MSTGADSLTEDEARKLGEQLRDYGNPIVGAFAAECVGESYPFSAEMAQIVLHDWTDEHLGRQFARWVDKQETQS